MSSCKAAGDSCCALACIAALVCLLAVQSEAAHGRSAAEEKKDVFPLKTQFSTVELDMSANNASCPSHHQRSTARELIHEEIQSRLPGIPQQLITCDAHHIGKVPHCAVENCSVLFQQITKESGLILFSGFYWLKLTNSITPEKVYCNRETGYPEVSSCRLLFSYHPTAQSGYYTLLLRDGVRLVVYCDRDSGLPQPESCGQAYQLELSSGHYTLRPPPTNLPLNYTVFCDMDHEQCGADGKWWTHIASLNMSDTNTSCPSNWSLVSDPIRGCSSSSPAESGCDSVKFSSLGYNYTKVCGRVVAHQGGRGFGFWPLTGRNQDVDGHYLSGVSITHGTRPRTHVWSFAASLGIFYCPCAPEYETSRVNLMGENDFVGNHYFCEMGRQGQEPDDGEFDLENPLWDGTTCFERDSCCSFNNPPWFTRDLPGPTTDDIEVRICGISPVTEASTPISLLDIYIH
jgi:hypothetical protein